MIRVELLTPVKLVDARFAEDAAMPHPVGAQPVVSRELADELTALGFAVDLGPIEGGASAEDSKPSKAKRGGKVSAT